MRFSFDRDGCFKILQITDLHYEDGGPKDLKMKKVVRDLIAAERPQLIFITGDFVTNEHNTACARDALEPVLDSQIPFVYVYGNHDAEYGKPHPEITRVMAGFKTCVNPATAEGVPGHSNFTLEVVGSSGVPEWLLIGVDSHMYNQDERVKGYDYVKIGQILWYMQEEKRLEKENAAFGSLCFLHMPLPEYLEAYRTRRRIGHKLEGVCCPKQNSGLFSAMLQGGHTRGVFCGHDHINDYCAELYGITLGFTRAAGFSTYGRRGFQKGGRAIVLREGDTRRFETWIRLADGRVQDRFISGTL